MIEVYKILTGKSLVRPDTWFTFVMEKDGAVNTRASTAYLNLLLPPVPNTELRNNFFSHRVIPTWNALPVAVKMAQTTDSFKSLYDSHTGY